MMENLSIHPQVITDGAGKELGVFLTTDDFEKLLEELEELEDIKAYDEAKSRKNEEFIPFSQAMEEIKMGLTK